MPDYACVNNARYTLENRIQKNIINLSRPDFRHAVREYIHEGKLLYSEHARARMDERVISEKDVEYALRHPGRIEHRVLYDRPSNPNEYTVMGLTKNRNRLRIGIAFEYQDGGRLVVVTVIRP